MKGKYNVVIGNNKITYDFVLERQVTILKGNSGSGKSTLFQMFENIVRRGKTHSLGYKCNCKDKLRIIDSDFSLSSIRSEHNKIFIADEYCDLIQTREFSEALSSSDNYFIFITRSGRMRWLTYSVKDIYELRTTKDESGKFVTRLYSRYLDISNTIKPDLIVTEDSNSGYDMFSIIFTDKDIVSAHGRDNIYNLLDKSDFKCAYIIVDGAAFGSCIGRIFPKFNNKVFIFAPESFEYLLLNTSTFKRFLDDELTNTYNYCDTCDFLSWERYFTYLLERLCKEKVI